MFIVEKDAEWAYPVRVWLESPEQVDAGAWQQVRQLTSLPFLHQWIALMPDVHAGFGMPIGGVAALEGVVIPNAVGKDIGCGVICVDSDIHKSELDWQAYTELVECLLEEIPTGFARHEALVECPELTEWQGLTAADGVFAAAQRSKHPRLWEEVFPASLHQLGTLGGGNHFIEIQEDEYGMLYLMVHSGSRHLGSVIADYFDKLAVDWNAAWAVSVPASYRLAYLPEESALGKDYIAWMELALSFAALNRRRMLQVVMQVVGRFVPHGRFGTPLDVHHNYAAKERHYGKSVWVHRKGAIAAHRDQPGIIPGAMGAHSYLVEGLGEAASFCSCSHGAGRSLSRKQALQRYSVPETLADLRNQQVILGKRQQRDVAEEARLAYKDIDFVIAQQLDLIRPLKQLKTICVVKG